MGELICPDCLINELKTDNEKENKICRSCRQRRTICLNSGNPYIKFINLSNEEKTKLLRRREVANNYTARKNNKLKSNDVKSKIEEKTKETNTIIGRGNKYPAKFHEICKRDGTRELKEIMQDIANELPEFANIPYKTMWGFMNRNGYPYTPAKKLGRPKRVEDELSTETYIIDDKEDIDSPIEIENELFDTSTIINNPDINIDLNNIDLKYKEEVDEHINDIEPTRFIPIRQEINEILDHKYKSLNCTVERNYTTEDYINMLDMLSYLIDNCDKIIKARNDQHDILNAYQSDTIHECENIIAEEGDTYIQDKLHILRKERRYYEYDCNDMTVISYLLKTLNKAAIDKVLDMLKEIYTKRKSPKFIPLVDYSMITKYEWAIPGDINSKKLQKPILVTNDKKKKNNRTTQSNRSRSNNTQVNNSSNIKNNNPKVTLKKFKVSAELCGCGLGVFKPWTNEYICLDESYAKKWAENTLNQLINTPEHKGAYYTNLKVLQLD